MILTLFITVLTISFLLLSASSASVEFRKLTTFDKMILLAVKLSRLDVSSTHLKQAVNFPLKLIYGQPGTRSRIWEFSIKSRDKKLTAKKGNLLADHGGNAISNFFKSIFIVKQVVLVFSGINVQWPKVLFSKVVEKASCSAFINVM